MEPTAADSAESFVQRLQDVLQFLTDNGFEKAASAVYSQLEKAEADVDAVALESRPEEYVEEPEANAEADFRSRSADPVLQGSGGASQAGDEAEDSPLHSLWAAGASETLQTRLSGSSRLYEDPDLDEYSSMEDSGYVRRSISNQQEFIMNQLDFLRTNDDDCYFHSSSLQHGGGSSSLQRADSCSGSSSASLSSPGMSSCAHTHQQDHQGHEQQQQQHGDGGEEQGDAGGELTSHPDLAAVGIRLSTSASSSSAAAAARAAVGATGDAAWDSGPAGITFAEPVTTPTKDSQRDSISDLQPSLSRVESLSNSFIEDYESVDGGAGIGGEGGGGAGGGGGGLHSRNQSFDAGSNAGDAVLFGGSGTPPRRSGADSAGGGSDAGAVASTAAAAVASGQAPSDAIDEVGIDLTPPSPPPECAADAGFDLSNIFELGLRASSRTSSVDVLQGSVRCWSEADSDAAAAAAGGAATTLFGQQQQLDMGGVGPSRSSPWGTPPASPYSAASISMGGQQGGGSSNASSRAGSASLGVVGGPGGGGAGGLVLKPRQSAGASRLQSSSQHDPEQDNSNLQQQQQPLLDLQPPQHHQQQSSGVPEQHQQSQASPQQDHQHLQQQQQQPMPELKVKQQACEQQQQQQDEQGQDGLLVLSPTHQQQQQPQPQRQRSGNNSDSGSSSAAGPVTPTAAVVVPAAASSSDASLAADAAAAAAAAASASAVGDAPAAAQPTPPADEGTQQQKQQQQQQEADKGCVSPSSSPPPAAAAAAAGSGAAAGGFGFSFPTTPPSAVDAAVHEERAERVFSTWASNHSRSLSGALDFEGLADAEADTSSSKPPPVDGAAAAAAGAEEADSSAVSGSTAQWGFPDLSAPTAPAAAADGDNDAPSSSEAAAGEDATAAATAAGAAGGTTSRSSSQHHQQQQQDEEEGPDQITLVAPVSPVESPFLAGSALASCSKSSSPAGKALSRGGSRAHSSSSAAGQRPAAASGGGGNGSSRSSSRRLSAAGRQQQQQLVGTSSSGGGARSPLGGADGVGVQQQQQHQQHQGLSSASGNRGSSHMLHLQGSAGYDALGNALIPALDADAESTGGFSGSGGELSAPRYVIDESGNLLYEYDTAYIDNRYETFELRVIHRRRRTGFEDSKEFPIRKNDLIAGRYQVMDFLGSAAFSQAVQALDVATGALVCLKIIKNNKDYFDQSLDEIKLLRYVNNADPDDEHHIVRLYDFFYYKEHLILVCELLRANLYEFQKYQRENGDDPYFTPPRIQRIAIQVLQSLAFLHSLGLVHSDLKPENILIKSYSRCEVKVIDLGSSCFITDHLSSYVQSRSYRAPEVILGLPYGQKIDIWSLGCILAELATGYVLFQNDSLATLLARLEGILGPLPPWMVSQGRYSNRYYTRSRQLYERSKSNGRYELLTPKQTSLRHRVPAADEGFLDFLSYLLTPDPSIRPGATEALQHPWLQHPYPPVEQIPD